MVGNWWYKRKGGDSTRKKKSKIKNKNFSFEASFSRKSTLNFRSVRVHFITSRYNGSHCRSLPRWILSQFKFVFDFYLWSHIKSIVYSEEIASCEQLKEEIIVAFHTLKQSNTLESVHRNLIRRAEVCVRQNGQHFQQFL